MIATEALMVHVALEAFIKEAVPKWKRLLLAGRISGKGTKRLARGGLEIDPVREVAGLRRGNIRMAKHIGRRVPLDVEEVTRLGPLRKLVQDIKKDPEAIDDALRTFSVRALGSATKKGVGGVTAGAGRGLKVVVPKRMKPGVKELVTRHELEEASRAARRAQRGKSVSPYAAGLPSKGIVEKARSYLPQFTPLGAPAGKPVAHLSPGRRYFQTSHFDPGVLLRESELLGRMPKHIQKKMKALRKGSGESEMMKRLGLRYGQGPATRRHAAQFLRRGRAAAAEKQPGLHFPR
jgi:hypothetical protein